MRDICHMSRAHPASFPGMEAFSDGPRFSVRLLTNHNNAIQYIILESVQHILRLKGMRMSHQRMKILVFLRERMDHPSAKQVYESLVPEMPSLSRMTVYNTLTALSEKDLVTMIMAPDGAWRYEYKVDEHCHFFCVACGRVIDTEFACRHNRAVELQGHHVHSVQGCFYGVCRECIEGRNNPLHQGDA